MRCPIGILVSISQPATAGERIEILCASRSDRFCLFARFLELDHGAPAVRGAAVARELLLQYLGNRLIELHVIIIKKFFSGLDIANRINEDAIVFLDRFAVWIARMIDPARVVSTNFRIDYLAVFQSEIKGVWIVFIIRRGFP